MNRLTLALIVCSTFSLFAQQPIGQLARAFAAGEELDHAIVGISVVEVATGRSVASVNAELALIPASTQKLLTTAAALHYLGPDHRFRTRLVAEGTRTRGGELVGNLRIVGGGDPTLGSPYLDGVSRANEVVRSLVAAVRAEGITGIRGGVVGDGRYFGTDGAGAGWPWADLGNYYGAGSYGLNFHENFYFLDLIQRSRVGERPMIQGARPAGAGVSITNELRSGPAGSGDQAYLYGAPFNYDYYLRGSIPIGQGRFTIKGSVPEPDRWLASQLTDALAAAGIRTLAPASSARKENPTGRATSRTIWEATSPPLLDIVDRTNRRSNNLYAETLLREINKQRGVLPEESAGTALVLDYLGGLGVDTSGVQLSDGSGLGPRNFFAPSVMTALLVANRDNEALIGTLPEITGGVHAKSGSINAVRCYAGYVDRADGRRLAFALMVNNYTLRGKTLRQRMLRLMRDLRTASLP